MSDWWLGQLARQDQYGEPPPANWPEQSPPDAFEAAAARVRAPYRNAAPVGARIGQLAEQITSMPSWADVATEQMNKDKEAFRTGGIGSLLADTSVAQELAGGFGGTTKAVGKPVIGELASPFYSAAGRAVENAKLGKGTGEQWLGYLRNQPGVKPEELQYVFGNLPKEGMLTKAQMQAHAAENAVTLGEVVKGKRTELPEEWLNRPFEEMTPDELARLNTRDNPTKYSQWQLPGGENYRETLLTLPSEMPKEMIAARDNVTRLERQAADQMAEWKGLAEASPPGDPATLAAYQRLASTRRELGAADELAGRLSNQRADATFRSSHWDEPNVLAHVRTNDREIPGVGKSLHVEEIQSDWHQKGRGEGYRQQIPEAERPAAIEKLHEFETRLNELGPQRSTAEGAAAYDALRAEATTLRNRITGEGGVPDAPFKSTWADVALKRQIREASEKGYDAISWTPGEAQAARYDLSKHIDSLKWYRDGDNYRISAGKDGELVLHEPVVPPEKLADTVGKELAEKIAKSEEQHGVMSGLDLKVGGEGMRAFYDKMLVDKANAIGKKHGARVEQGPLPAEKPSEIELRRLHDNTKPDEIATAKYSKQWDELVADKHAILAQNNDPTLKQSPLYKQAGLARINQIEGELDKLHQVMVSETVKRVVAERKGPAAHVLRITPELRAAAMKGFPLFTAGGLVVGGAMGELARQDKYGRNE